MTYRYEQYGHKHVLNPNKKKKSFKFQMEDKALKNPKKQKFR